MPCGTGLAKLEGMMLSRKLSQWRRAELIDDATADRIRAFEADHGKPMLLQALVGLGALTIGIGVISIVAANWSGIAYPWKLTAAGLLCALVAISTYVSHSSRRELATEGSVLVYYVLTLACVALLGQIYQSGTPAWQALLFWSAATAPLLSLMRTGFGGIVGFIGSTLTYVVCVAAGVEHMSGSNASNAAAVAFTAWPLTAIAAAKLSPLSRRRPRVARAVSTAGWLIIFSGGALLPFAFYENTEGDHLTWAIPVTGVLVAGFLVALGRWTSGASPPARLGLSLCVGTVWLFLALGVGVGHGSLDVVGAVAQVVFLGVLAWTSVHLGRTTVFNVLTALIALRVLVIYFEVFGSMLSTGVGMITGGGLTLAMAWLWKRSRRS